MSRAGSDSVSRGDVEAEVRLVRQFKPFWSVLAEPLAEWWRQKKPRAASARPFSRPSDHQPGSGPIVIRPVVQDHLGRTSKDHFGRTKGDHLGRTSRDHIGRAVTGPIVWLAESATPGQVLSSGSNRRFDGKGEQFFDHAARPERDLPRF